MRSKEDGRGFSHGTTHDSTGINFEFQRANSLKRTPQHRTALGKPTPSKWDDAQKWLVGLSRSGERNHPKTQPRNSNADDLRLIAPVPQTDYPSSEDEGRGDTKKIDGGETGWQINDLPQDSASAVRSIQVRDMGTEMTPIASLEPSRSATPIRATTPEVRSPIASVSAVPARSQQGTQASEGYNHRQAEMESRTRGHNRDGYVSNVESMMNLNQVKKLSPLEIRAMAWDEAVRAKNMARYKREEIKIQTWENHEKRKAEMEMKRMEVKAERLKARAQEKLANRLAATKRIAEEKRANAETTLNERAMRTSERADYIKRTGHLPSSFSFKLPSLCWH